MPRFFKPKEFLLVKIFGGLALLCLIFLGIRFYTVHLDSVPKAGGTYIEGLVGQPRLVNPVLSPLYEADNDIAYLVFSGLMRRDKNQDLIPELAKEFSISEDKLTYTFTLKDNLRWHDDKPLTTKDIAFTVSLIKDPIIKSPLASNFNNVTTEVVNDQTIKFKLAEPYAPFISTTTFGILPQHIWGKIPNNQFSLAEYNLKPIGNGPYIFKSLAKDKLGFVKTYTLEKNPDYFKQPYIDKLIFRFYNDSQQAVADLRSSKIDGLAYNRSDWEDKLGKENKKINKHSLRLPQYTAIFFNQEKSTILEEQKIRQALKLATNKDQIIKNTLGGDAEIIAGPITEGMVGYHEDLVKNEPNKDKAREILDEIGWTLKEDKEYRTKDEQELSLILTTIDQLNYVQVAKEIQSMWQKIGIKTDIEVIPPEYFQSEIIKPKNYQVLLYSVITGADPDPYPIWHSTQTGFSGLNLSLFKDDKVDKLLNEARKITDYQERDKRYKEFQEILNEKIPAVFLYNRHYNYFTNKEIKGIDLKHISIPQDRFSNIFDWYIKTSKKL